MGTAEQAAPLRALGTGEILDASVKIFRRHFKTLAMCVIIFALPLGLVSTMLQLSANPDAFDVSAQFDYSYDPEADPVEIDSTEVAAFASAMVLSGLLFGLSIVACFRAVGAAYLGAPTTWRESIVFAAKRLHSVVWVAFLFMVCVIVGSLFCLLPGIWLWVALGFAIPVLLFENIRGTSALQRSFRLVKGRWWPTFGVLIVGTVLVSVLQFVATILLSVLFLVVPDNYIVTVVLATLLTVAGYVFTLPIQAAFYALIYFDLRVRKEGFDLMLLAQRIDAGAAVAPPIATIDRGEPRPEPGAWPPPPQPQPQQPRPPDNTPHIGGFLPPKPPE